MSDSGVAKVDIHTRSARATPPCKNAYRTLPLAPLRQTAATLTQPGGLTRGCSNEPNPANRSGHSGLLLGLVKQNADRLIVMNALDGFGQ